MPITRRQFDLGIDDAMEGSMRAIHAFLASKKNQAFSKEEVFAGIAGKASLKAFNKALEKLAEVRAVDVRYVKDQAYYAYLEDLNRVW